MNSIPFTGLTYLKIEANPVKDKNVLSGRSGRSSIEANHRELAKTHGQKVVHSASGPRDTYSLQKREYDAPVAPKVQTETKKPSAAKAQVAAIAAAAVITVGSIAAGIMGFFSPKPEVETFSQSAVLHEVEQSTETPASAEQAPSQELTLEKVDGESTPSKQEVKQEDIQKEQEILVNSYANVIADNDAKFTFFNINVTMERVSKTLGENALEFIEDVCQKYTKDVTPEQVATIIFKESSGFHDGAPYGVMETTPICVEEVKRIHKKNPEIQELDWRDPKDNIIIGTLYFQICLDRKDSIEEAFAYYNSSDTAKEYGAHAIALHNDLTGHPEMFKAVKYGDIVSDWDNNSVLLASTYTDDTSFN